MPQQIIRLAARRHTEPNEDHDRELQPFRSMDRHDAHGIVVRFRHDALLDLCPLFRLPLEPVDQAAQRRFGALRMSARLFRDEAQPLPALAWSAINQRQLEEPALCDDIVDQPCERHPPATLMLRTQPHQCFDHRIVIDTGRGVTAEVPATAGGTVADEIIIPACEGR